jgi:DNA-binding beta-propeller fold protein YncE
MTQTSAQTSAHSSTRSGAEFLVSNFSSATTTDDRIVRFELGAPASIIDHFVARNVSPMVFAQDISFGPDGHLYVTSSVSLSSNDARVLRFDGSTGRPMGDFIPPAAGLQTASGLVFTRGGHVLVTNFVGDKVMRFDASSGSFVDDFIPPGAGGLDGAGDIALDGSGDVYVTSSFTDSVLKFDGVSGAFIEEAVPSGAAGLTAPTGIVIDDRSVLHVCSRDTNTVIARDLSEPPSTAAVLVPAGTGGMDGPAGIAISPAGTLVVACFRSGHVLEFDRDAGSLIAELVPPGSFGLTFPGPVAVCFKPEIPEPCYADCDGSATLDIFDFLCFQDAFVTGCP